MGYGLEVFIRLVRQVVMRLVRLCLVVGVVSLSFRSHLFVNEVEGDVNPVMVGAGAWVLLRKVLGHLYLSRGHPRTVVHRSCGLRIFFFQGVLVCFSDTALGAKVTRSR